MKAKKISFGIHTIRFWPTYRLQDKDSLARANISVFVIFTPFVYGNFTSSKQIGDLGDLIQSLKRSQG